MNDLALDPVGEMTEEEAHAFLERNFSRGQRQLIWLELLELVRPSDRLPYHVISEFVGLHWQRVWQIEQVALRKMERALDMREGRRPKVVHSTSYLKVRARRRKAA